MRSPWGIWFVPLILVLINEQICNKLFWGTNWAQLELPTCDPSFNFLILRVVYYVFKNYNTTNNNPMLNDIRFNQNIFWRHYGEEELSKWSTPKRLKVIIRVEGGHYTGSSRNSYEGRWWRTLVVSTGLSRAATIALGADESSGAGQQCGGARGGGCVVKGGSSARDSAPPPVLLITHVSASRKYVLSATCSSSTLYILPTKHNDFTTITIQIKYFTFIIKHILWVQQILTIKKKERHKFVQQC